MKIILLLAVLMLTSCASVEKLKASKTCNVWEDQKIFGPLSIEVNQNEAYWKGECGLFYMWLCTWVKADMPDGQSSIFLDGNGVFVNRKVYSKLQDEKIIFEPTFLDGLVKSSPALINRKELRTNRTITTAIANISSEEEFHFNESCTNRQVAIGTMALIAVKNKN
jgi:hypothetical protein